MTTVLMKATEALAIAKPSFEVGVADAVVEVADAIKKAAEGGVTAIIARLQTAYVPEVTAVLVEAGYEVTRHLMSDLPGIAISNVSFYQVDWTGAK